MKRNRQREMIIFRESKLVRKGEDLIELAWMAIEKAQYMLGGMVTFLEAENEEKLLSFYRDNRFSQFDTRQTVSNADEPHELVQLLRLL
ncbi:MAG: hypothetical protein NC300_10570 [Bacteroidales bacterium]|nr:hypothetical protein [Clostridium sp.]MCM1204575.1 hypothetical protein [Bacteroidales bacterium]